MQQRRLVFVAGGAVLALIAAGLAWGAAPAPPRAQAAMAAPEITDAGPDAWATIAAADPRDGPTPAAAPAATAAGSTPWLVLDPSFRLAGPPYQVAHVTAPSVAIFDRPDAVQPRMTMSNRTPLGGPRVFVVVASAGDRLEVLLPTRPNDSVGWIPASSAAVSPVTTWVSVDLGAHTLTAGDANGQILRETVATGTGGTPTPRGIYYVTDLIRPVGQPAYGPYAFALSAHSDVLYNFAGGDGTVGIHGTNQPGALGQSVSHGCVRMSNAGVTALAQALPLGTPVFIG